MISIPHPHVVDILPLTDTPLPFQFVLNFSPSSPPQQPLCFYIEISISISSAGGGGSGGVMSDMLIRGGVGGQGGERGVAGES